LSSIGSFIIIINVKWHDSNMVTFWLPQTLDLWLPLMIYGSFYPQQVPIFLLGSSSRPCFVSFMVDISFVSPQVYVPFREWLKRNIIDNNWECYGALYIKTCIENFTRELRLMWLSLFKRHKDQLLILWV